MDYDAAALDPGHLVLVHVRASAADLTHRPLARLDFAGVVESVGRRVSAFRPGDAVYGVGDIAFAGYLCAPQHEIARMPASLDFDTAATVPLAGLAALQALRDRARVQRGERLLVASGPGAASRLAVQIGVGQGARVTAACRPSDMDGYRALGADVVDLETTSGSTYEVIVQFGRTHARDRYARALAPGGRLVIAGDAPVLRSGADLATLAALIDSGVLTPPASAPPGYT
jgi:NADPH:quinone reductase-like Zn-dependent oxidoreductase